MLNGDLQRRFVRALCQVPGMGNQQGRGALLAGLPENIVAGLNRSDNCLTDMTNLITQLEQLGRLQATGERPLIIIADNALLSTEGTEIGGVIKEIRQELEQRYGGDPPSEFATPIPEIVVGRDERLPPSFLEKALLAGKSVARLRVPRISDGHLREGEWVYGTGWLVAPELLFTNHHVVAARMADEPAASQTECQAQASSAVAWFDYHREGGTHVERQCCGLVCSDETLDYALIRLESSAQLDDRQTLPIASPLSALRKGDRLNIVQYPGGGPLRYAMRSNFYVGTGDTPNHIRYLTDTEAGSSGSPVLNDDWQVIAMHHAYRQVPEEMYKGEVVKYHNQGIDIRAILNHLSLEVQREIELVQGR